MLTEPSLLNTFLSLLVATLLLAAPLVATWGIHRAFSTMVGPQDRFRKLWYFVAILQLFMLGYVWRYNTALPVRCIDTQAAALSIREESRGDPDLTGSVVRLGLTGSRGLATCFLWNQAIEAQKKNQWNTMEVYVRSLTKLQPHFIRPWLFQSWNLSYNVSVESDRPRDKYFFVARGIELLVEGEHKNHHHPDLRWSIGFYLQHKIMQSDDTNYLRSLLQLSVIPPNERDPARFWKKEGQEIVFNDAEFEDFVRKHPQLVRRLRDGMRKESEMEKKRQFSASRPEDVVSFLGDNFNVPSLYKPRVIVSGLPANVRGWNPDVKDEKLDDEAQRFPPLPPEGKYDPTALSFGSQLRDDHDGFSVAHAWFAYAQEPLPEPDPVLPGFSVEITDRTRQRRPRHMTTLIFRNYPAQARRYYAERLQQEGWYDEEPWDTSAGGIKGWDRLPGFPVKVGGGEPWSRRAWQDAYDAWKLHGERNHILFASPEAAENNRILAKKYSDKHPGVAMGSMPIPLNEAELAQLDEEKQKEYRDEYLAARILYEYTFYRQVSNFPHHYNRALVEAKPETVACRKLLADADWARLTGEKLEALKIYQTPTSPKKLNRQIPAWGDRELTPLEAWRELVLLPNEEFRRDSFNQESAAEVQIRYLKLHNDLRGQELKKKVMAISDHLPLVPALSPEGISSWIIEGPLDLRYVKNARGEWEVSTNGEGEQLITDASWDTAMDRARMPGRRGTIPTPEPMPIQSQPEGKQ